MPEEIEVEQTYEPLLLAPRQLEGMELARKRRFTLFSGPRISGKTGAALPAVCDHAWRIPNADIAVVTISQSAGLESGVWDQLTETIIPRYMQSMRAGMIPPGTADGRTMEWHKRPHIRNVTKRPACVVTNMHGGTSKLRLESLNDEEEVEARFKSKNCTMMYVPELSNFRSPKTFSIWTECLRAYGLPDEYFLFLGDTNPSDEGDESWIYHEWFIIPRLTYLEYCMFQQERGLEVPEERVFNVKKESLGLLEFEIGDNIFLSQRRVDELVSKYLHDKDLYDRYIKGLWVKATTNALFAKQFKEIRHVIGEMETPANQNPLMLVPQRDTWVLHTGWDPGNSANSAAVIFEKWKPVGPDGKLSVYPHFKLLDEVAIIGKDHTLIEFVHKFCEKMDYWERVMGRKFQWEHWSDRSVFDTKDPLSKRYYHQIIHEASGGRITLRAADRSPGSVERRVDVARRLFFEDRLQISKAKCPRAITMFKAMPSNKNKPNEMAKGTPHKHIFDAITYGIASEVYDEMIMSVINLQREKSKNDSHGVIVVPS